MSPEPFSTAVLYRHGAPVEVRHDDPVWAGGAIVDAVCDDRANHDAYRMVFTQFGGYEKVTTGADVVAMDRAHAERLGLRPIWPADAAALERAEVWGWTVAPDLRFERVTYFGQSSFPTLDRPAPSKETSTDA